jgi:hypothetical protein
VYLELRESEYKMGGGGNTNRNGRKQAVFYHFAKKCETVRKMYARAINIHTNDYTITQKLLSSAQGRDF